MTIRLAVTKCVLSCDVAAEAWGIAHPCIISMMTHNSTRLMWRKELITCLRWRHGGHSPSVWLCLCRYRKMLNSSRCGQTGISVAHKYQWRAVVIPPPIAKLPFLSLEAVITAKKYTFLFISFNKQSNKYFSQFTKIRNSVLLNKFFLDYF